MQKLIINFTPTGMIPTKDMTPYVPISAEEVIEEVHAAYEVGITMAHLHARDEAGVPTYKSEVYARIMEGIRAFCPDLVICLSLSGRNINEFEKRSEAITLYPDMGSLTLSSLNFSRQASVNDPDTINRLASKMKEYGVRPELEVFDLGMINYAKYLIRKKLIEPPYYFNIILGNIAGMQCDLGNIATAINDLPEQSVWSLGGIGDCQLTANSIAISMGWGVRVGLEDNLYFDKAKNHLTSNLELINRIHQMADIHQREIMLPSEFGDLGFYNSKRLEKLSQ